MLWVLVYSAPEQAEALERLLRSAVAQIPAAWLVLTGLEAQEVSALQRALWAQLPQVPVWLGEDGLRLQAPGVYLLPSGAEPALEEGELWVHGRCQPCADLLEALGQQARRAAVVLLGEPPVSDERLQRLRADGGAVVRCGTPTEGLGRGAELAASPEAAWELLASSLPPGEGLSASATRGCAARQVEGAWARAWALERHLEEAQRELRALREAHQRQGERLGGALRDVRDLFLYGEDALLLLDDALCVRRCAETARRWFRLLPEDLGRPLTHVVTEIPREALFGAIYEALRTHSASVREAELPAEGGPLEIWAWPGAEGGVVLSIRERALPAAREASPQHSARAWVRANLSPALLVDEGEGVVCANRALAQLLEQALSEIEGRALREVLGREALVRLSPSLRRVVSGEAVCCELELPLPPQLRPRLLRVQLQPQRSAAGALEGVVLALEDLTAVREETRRLLQVEAQRREAERLESFQALMGSIAHDLNNLVTVVLTNASILQARLEGDRVGVDIADEILQATRRIRDVTHSSFVGAQEPVQQRFLDLSAVAQRVERVMRAATTRRALQLELEMTPDLPSIYADETLLHRVLVNLVTNAVEAIPEGQPDGMVVVATGVRDLNQDFCDAYRYSPQLRPGRYVFLEVSDTGVGMGPERLRGIFDPKVSTKGPNRGWGLPTVLSIVQSFDGAVEVLSTPDAGSTFLIYLPSCEEKPLERSRETLPPLDQPPRQLQERQPLILVVDDEEALLRAQTMLLKHQGFSVLTARGGLEAIREARVQREPIAAALLDLTMPQLSGLETLRTLREIIPGLPVLLTSGYANPFQMEHLPLDHQTEFLLKPASPHALVAALQRLLGFAQPAEPA